MILTSQMILIKKLMKEFFLLEELLGILGFKFEDKNQNDSEIINLIKKRNELRLEKEYDKADQIREDLLSRGIEILDSKDGTTFRKI